MKTGLADALFSHGLQKILSLLYGQPDKAFYTNEIIRLTHSGTGAVQRDLQKLSDVGLVLQQVQGNQKYYQANQKTPIFSELRSIILKTCGLSDVLNNALHPLDSKITIAFIYGSVAKGEDTVSSDIDVMLIGEDLSYAELFPLIEQAEMQMQRPIHLQHYTAEAWVKKRQAHHHFITQLILQPKIFLKGNEDALIKLG